MGKNVLTVIVPILISKDVFEPSYSDLRCMVQKCNFVATYMLAGGFFTTEPPGKPHIQFFHLLWAHYLIFQV